MLQRQFDGSDELILLAKAEYIERRGLQGDQIDKRVLVVREKNHWHRQWFVLKTQRVLVGGIKIISLKSFREIEVTRLDEDVSGRYISLSIYGLISILCRKVLWRRQRDVENGLVIRNEMGLGYFHWMCETLVSLWAARNTFGEVRHTVILEAQAAKLPFIRESLDILGFRYRYSTRFSPVKCKTLIVGAPSAKTGNYREQDICAMSSEIKKRVLGNDKGIGCEGDVLRTFTCVYISRKKASRRRMRGEEELVQILKEIGVECVCLEDYRLIEQIRMFSSCSYLISQHGAGLTNMLWMERGTTVLELRREGDDTNNCYYSLASCCYIDYRCQILKSCDGDSHNSDLALSSNDIESIRKEILDSEASYLHKDRR